METFSDRFVWIQLDIVTHRVNTGNIMPVLLQTHPVKAEWDRKRTRKYAKQVVFRVKSLFERIPVVIDCSCYRYFILNHTIPLIGLH